MKERQSQQIECEFRNTASYEKSCSAMTQLLQDKKVYALATVLDSCPRLFVSKKLYGYRKCY